MIDSRAASSLGFWNELPRKPYRLFFPLGIAISWVGVGQWLLFTSGRIEAYLSIFHSMAQVQGFLICFAMGFLFTMLPRRTESAPPPRTLLLLCAACPLAITLAAALEFWIWAQAAWLLLLGLLARFAIPRLVSGKRRPPVSFLWLPIALICGTVGSVMTGFGAAIPGWWTLHEIGRSLVLQGFFLCLVLGVGSFVVPLFTRGEGLRDADLVLGLKRQTALHCSAAVLLILSFVVEWTASQRGGYALRAALLFAVLSSVGKIHRFPTKRGTIRLLVWIGVWCVPSGYLLGALFPSLGKGALHVTFVGGFGLLVLAVSSQVVLGHEGREALRDRAWIHPLLIVLLLLAAVAARALYELQSERQLLWMTTSATAFLLATLAWGALLRPALRRA